MFDKNKITNKDILNAIEQLKTGKSGCDDMLTNEFFSQTTEVYLSSVLSVNCSPVLLTTGEINGLTDTV